MNGAYAPASLYAGDAISWEVHLQRPNGPTLYTAADGYSPLYILNLRTSAGTKARIADGETGITITEGDPGIFEITLAGSFTNTLPVGTLDWVLFADTSGERYHITNGSIEILPNVETEATYDPRTHAQKMVDAIDAHLEALTRGELGMTSISIATPDGNRSFTQMERSEIITWRNYYLREVEREQDLVRRRQGQPSRRYIKSRFV